MATSVCDSDADYRIQAELYPATGTPVSIEVASWTQVFCSDTTPAVAMTDDGGFVVAWRAGDVARRELGGCVMRIPSPDGGNDVYVSSYDAARSAPRDRRRGSYYVLCHSTP